LTQKDKALIDKNMHGTYAMVTNDGMVKMALMSMEQALRK
jgi:hypothetical protein